MLLCNIPIWRNYFLHVVRNFSVPINSARNGVQEKGIVTSLIEDLRPSHCVLVPSAITRRSSTPLLVSPPSQGSRLHMHNWFVFLLFSSPKSNNFLVSFELLPLKYFPIFLVKNVQPFLKFSSPHLRSASSAKARNSSFRGWKSGTGSGSGATLMEVSASSISIIWLCMFSSLKNHVIYMRQFVSTRRRH